MTEFTIKLEDADAANAVFTLRSNYKGGAPHAYKLIADQIEEQIPPAIEEPTEFGSLIEATTESGRQLLQLATPVGKHYWENKAGGTWLWSELADVEVLRAGVGEAISSLGTCSPESDDYSTGYAVGADARAAVIRARLIALRDVAITDERKDAYDTAIREVR